MSVTCWLWFLLLRHELVLLLKVLVLQVQLLETFVKVFPGLFQNISSFDWADQSFGSRHANTFQLFYWRYKIRVR